MDIDGPLRYVSLALIFVGLYGLATSFASSGALFPVSGDTAFFVGLALFSVGIVLLMYLGRRARMAAMESGGP